MFNPDISSITELESAGPAYCCGKSAPEPRDDWPFYDDLDAQQDASDSFWDELSFDFCEEIHSFLEQLREHFDDRSDECPVDADLLNRLNNDFINQQEYFLTKALLKLSFVQGGYVTYHDVTSTLRATRNYDINISSCLAILRELGIDIIDPSEIQDFKYECDGYERHKCQKRRLLSDIPHSSYLSQVDNTPQLSYLQEFDYFKRIEITENQLRELLDRFGFTPRLYLDLIGRLEEDSDSLNTLFGNGSDDNCDAETRNVTKIKAKLNAIQSKMRCAYEQASSFNKHSEQYTHAMAALYQARRSLRRISHSLSFSPKMLEDLCNRADVTIYRPYLNLRNIIESSNSQCQSKQLDEYTRSILINCSNIERDTCMGANEFISTFSKLKSVLRISQEARTALIKANLYLVLSVAKTEYMRSRRRMSFSDLVQEGNITLVAAVDTFNYKTGLTFTAYATWRIRKAVIQAIAKCTGLFSVPPTMISPYYNAHASLTCILGREATLSETAEYIIDRRIANLDCYEVDEYLSTGCDISVYRIAIAVQTPISLQRYACDCDTSNVGDPTEGIYLDHPAALLDGEMCKELMRKVLDCLTENERLALSYLLGLSGETPLTSAEVAKRLNRSASEMKLRVRKSLNKLRHITSSRLLDELHSYCMCQPLMDRLAVSFLSSDSAEQFMPKGYFDKRERTSYSLLGLLTEPTRYYGLVRTSDSTKACAPFIAWGLSRFGRRPDHEMYVTCSRGLRRGTELHVGFTPTISSLSAFKAISSLCSGWLNADGILLNSNVLSIEDAELCEDDKWAIEWWSICASDKQIVLPTR